MFRLLQAILLLSGMIIGVGMFAVPFSFAKAGFWPGVFELVILAATVTALHMLYGEIVLATPQFHRMPGYVRMYLGSFAARVSWMSTLVATVGTLLAYLVVGSLFLRTVAAALAPISPHYLALSFAGTVALVTFFPLKKESAINGVLTVFEIAFLAGISLLLIPRISPGNFSGAHPADLLLHYGVLLFALSGASVIPDVVTVLGRNKTRVRIAIVAGSLIPALLYVLFAYAVVGVTGAETSAEAIAGLQRALGGNIALWVSGAGFLAVLTSYIALSANFQALLALDLRAPRIAAWLAASAIPLALYAAGFRNFIAIIGAVGIVAFGVDAILFLRMGKKVREKTRNRSVIPVVIMYLVLAVIITGVTAALLRIFVL